MSSTNTRLKDSILYSSTVSIDFKMHASFSFSFPFFQQGVLIFLTSFLAAAYGTLSVVSTVLQIIGVLYIVYRCRQCYIRKLKECHCHLMHGASLGLLLNSSVLMSCVVITSEYSLWRQLKSYLNCIMYTYHARIQYSIQYVCKDTASVHFYSVSVIHWMYILHNILVTCVTCILYPQHVICLKSHIDAVCFWPRRAPKVLIFILKRKAREAITPSTFGEFCTFLY